ncbi:3-oxoacyl-[acyl-carrier-protein] synthase III C-terminal domain-containing protein [Streptomyces sp. NPDC050287]|uniref:3-oxoacyl-[acyl-carrier-protein] synthase III C-terminal domain-containing protein n=1 Tax=Streptomyces sp. NPDC050287 TaxID=3365608 RepID=UPI00379543F8
MSSTRAYLSRIAYAVGDRAALSELDDPVIARELDNLHQDGMSHCRVAKEGRTLLAVSAARQSLGGTPGEATDGVVYCTDTVAGTPTREVRRLLAGLECPPGPVMMAGGNACGNLGTGLEIATGWLSAGRASSVLLVTADEFTEGTRYLAAGRTALSDGAASCVVSTAPAGASFRILGMASGGAGGTEPAAGHSHALRETAEGIGQSVSRATEAAGVPVSDYRYILTGNLGHMMRVFLAMAAGFKPDRVYAPQVSSMAHCFAADILIALDSIVAEKLIVPGDKLMLLPTSMGSWSAIAVEHVDQRV